MGVIRRITVLGAVAALALPAAAQDTVAESVKWADRPSESDFQRLGPPEAVRTGGEGRATLECELNASGRPKSCALRSESPTGAGFGAAAQRLAPLYRLAPTQDVDLEGSRMTFTIRFRYPRPEAAAAPAPPLPPPSAMPSQIAGITPPPGRLAALSAAPGWQSDYLDASRVMRVDGQIEVYRVAVFAADQDGAAYEVSRLRLDCAGGYTLVGVRRFSRQGAAAGWREGAPSRPIAPDSVEAMIDDLACTGAVGDGDVPGIEAALLAR